MRTATETLRPIPENIPTGLKERNQWVGWVYAKRGGEYTKIPINPHTGGNASVRVPETWDAFERAYSLLGNKVHGMRVVQGVGFVLAADDPYVGYDFDGVRDAETGEIQEWALREVGRLDSYAEISPSGKGVRVMGRGSLPGPGGPHKTAEGHTLEIYDRKRFLTLTGHRLTVPETTETTPGGQSE